MSSVPLVGHEANRQALRRALSRSRLGQAYLFVGPEGIGKRRFAEFLAQALLCETHPHDSLDPCGQCAGCKQVTVGSHPDYFSLRKPDDKNIVPIEAIQNLCHQLAFKPARGRYKIAVVDDADDLSIEAANCFLKSLEEPAAGSVLILRARQIEKQLATVKSRCQVIRFHPLSTEQVAEVLRLQDPSEDEAKIQLWAQLSQGSVGQAHELADPEWLEFRKQWVERLTKHPFTALETGSFLQEYVEQPKESALKRGRARRAVQLVTSLARAVLYQQSTGEVEPTFSDMPSVAQLADRWPTDVVLDILERCFDADFHIARYLNLSLALETWVNDLADLLDNQYVPSIR